VGGGEEKAFFISVERPTIKKDLIINHFMNIVHGKFI
jgi:hypothetical protein